VVLFSSTAATGAVLLLLSTSAVVQPASAQASGTMQATVTVLAAAGPPTIEASAATSDPQTIEIRPAHWPDYARVDIEPPESPPPDADAAGFPEMMPVRVTVTYLQ